MANIEKIKCLIIGSGPAGYTAAIYASRANLNPVLYQGGQPGGQLTTTFEVENFPGYPEGVMGTEMMMQLEQQAKRFGTDIRNGWVTKVDFSAHPHKVWVDDQELHADAVIIATGAAWRKLGVPGEAVHIGRGVAFCPHCDGPFFKGKDVAVVGGGNSALLAASYLSNIAQKIFLIHRRNQFTAEKALVSQIKNSANIEILYNQEILACHVNEDNRLDSLILKNQQVLPVSSLFVEIGRLSSLTGIFQNSNLKSLLLFDQSGFIITDDSCSTNLAGLFAAGDCRSKNFRQLVTASSDGAIAANSAIEFLSQI